MIMGMQLADQLARRWIARVLAKAADVMYELPVGHGAYSKVVIQYACHACDAVSCMRLLRAAHSISLGKTTI
jgi:hypothetical protein